MRLANQNYGLSFLNKRPQDQGAPFLEDKQQILIGRRGRVICPVRNLSGHLKIIVPAGLVFLINNRNLPIEPASIEIAHPEIHCETLEVEKGSGHLSLFALVALSCPQS